MRARSGDSHDPGAAEARRPRRLPRAPAPSEPLLRRRHLRWFDLTRGTPIALRVLRRRLGTWALLRLLPPFVWGQLTGKPFRDLPPPRDLAERLTRHQLAPVLLLDRLLRERLSLAPDRAHALLEELVGASGAAFLAAQAAAARAPGMGGARRAGA